MKIQTHTYEKILFRLLAGWQVVNGILTAFIYSFHIRAEIGGQTSSLSATQTVSAEMLANNFFTLSFTLGILFIVLGVITFFVSRKLQAGAIRKPIIYWLLGNIFLAFLLMDVITIGLSLVLLALVLAKNKAYQKYQLA